jgi:chromosome segregation ATPase
MSGDRELMGATRRAVLRKLFRAAPDVAASAIDGICRSTDDQFTGNRYLSGRLAAANSRITQLEQQLWAEKQSSSARIAWLEDTKVAFEERARWWQTEAEQLRDVQQRFDDYFQRTQSYIASLKDAALFHEQQADHWRSEVEQLAKRERESAEYFRESQLWIANLQQAKQWNEDQASHWRSEAERLRANGTPGLLRRIRRTLRGGRG